MPRSTGRRGRRRGEDPVRGASTVADGAHRPHASAPRPPGLEDRAAGLPSAVVRGGVRERDRPDRRAPAATSSPTSGAGWSATPGCCSPLTRRTSPTSPSIRRASARASAAGCCWRWPARPSRSSAPALDAGGAGRQRGRAAAVPALRLRACRGAQAVLRGHGRRHRDVGPRHRPARRYAERLAAIEAELPGHRRCGRASRRDRPASRSTSRFAWRRRGPWTRPPWCSASRPPATRRPPRW